MLKMKQIKEKSNEMQRIHVIITGRVQGVLFRANTKRQAELIGVKGWVRNLDDDKVEAVGEGTEEQIKRFKPDVLGIIEYKLSRNRNGLISYLKTKKNGAFARVHQFNSVEGIPKNIFLPLGIFHLSIHKKEHSNPMQCFSYMLKSLDTKPFPY